MAEPAASIVALTTFALQASICLYDTIRSLKSQNRDARALRDEVGELSGVLETLLETISNFPSLNFDNLTILLKRCRTVCGDYEKLIARCTKHSNESRPSFRMWFQQTFQQGSINDFKAQLATYKATINIALANANIRVTAITPQVLEDYKDMISDATEDLKNYLQKVEEKEHTLSLSGTLELSKSTIEWEAMLEEKESIQQGLQLCDELSGRIREAESASKENPQFSQYPSTHKYIKKGLGAAKGSIQALMSRLQSHEEEIERRMEAMRSTVPISEDVTSQLAQLQETKESIHECLKVVSEANETVEAERRNVFEDITLADEAYSFSVSTVGDLVTARKFNISGRARNVGGTLDAESYQKTVASIINLDAKFMASAQELRQTPRRNTLDPDSDTDKNGGGKFSGRGFTLSMAKEVSDMSLKEN